MVIFGLVLSLLSRKRMSGWRKAQLTLWINRPSQEDHRWENQRLSVNRGIAYYQFVDGKNNKCELIKRNNKKRKKTTNWLRSPKKYFNKTSEKAQKKKKGLGTENHVTKAESETNIDQQPPSCSSWVELLLLLHLNPHSSKVHDFSHSDLILVFFSFLVILVLTPLRLFGNPFNFRFYLEPIDSSTRLRSLYLLRSLRFSLHAND